MTDNEFDFEFDNDGDDRSVPYPNTKAPAAGHMFVIKHYGRWCLQDSSGRFYGPYSDALDAIQDKQPQNGRALHDLESQPQ